MVALGLRAASAAAALVASSGPLSINENGTYYATVLLGSRSVKMAVDMQHFGIWVSCRVFEDDQCDVGVSGYPTYPYTSVEYGTRTIAELTIAGQVIKNLDVYVAYDSLYPKDPSFQGYIGLSRQNIPEDLPAFGKGANVTSIALQLGTSSADSALSLNTIDQTLLESKQLTTKTTVTARVGCVRLPVARSNTTVDDCTFTPSSSNYQARFDSTSTYLDFESTTVRKLEDRFLNGCSKVYSGGSSYATNWVGYTCNATMKLPRLMIQMAAWEFYLDPVDYTAPANATKAGVAQVRVLIGGSLTSDSWVFGTPFLRKFPIMFNATERFTTQYYNLFCTANTTCRNVPARTIPSIYSGDGTSGGTGGGGTSSDIDVDVDVSARRKRNKLYLSIGLGVGGVVVLVICGCLCKGCRGSDTDKDAEDGGGDGKESAGDVATVEVTIALTTGSGEASDDEDTKKKEDKDKGKDKDKSTTTAAAVKKKTRSQRDDSSGGSSESDDSSDYDSESSEERRRERRRRRRRRRERRRERKEKERGDPGEAELETDYVASSTPRAAQASS